MQAIASDLERSLRMMKTDDSKAQTISELMGYDVDSTYRQPINYIQSASGSELSIAGKTDVVGGQSLQINISDDNVLLSVRRSCVVFDVTINAAFLIPDNALAFFQPTQISLGKLTWSVASGQHMLQQYLHTQPREVLNKVAGGLLLDMRSLSSTAHAGLIEALPSAAGTAVAASNQFCRLAVQKNNYEQFKRISADTIRVCVPLEWIWPQLRETFAFDGLVYLGLGQKLTLSANIQVHTQFFNFQPAKFVAAGTNAFTIKNANLIKVFSNLDAERQSLLLRSVLPVQKIDVIAHEVPMAATIVLNYNINEKQRAQKLYIAHHWNKAVVQLTGDGTKLTYVADGGNEYAKSFVADVDGPATGSSYKNPTTYFPQLHRDISMIQISFGGEHRVLTQQMINSLADCGIVMDSYQYGLIDPVYQASHSVLCIDLSRFQHDMIGSSSGNQVSMQVTITYNVGSTFIYPGQEIEVANYANFTVKTFLQTASQAVLENGLYSMV